MEQTNTLTVNIDDLREHLGEACRLINNIRLDSDLKYKIPKTEDYLEITGKLFMAMKEISLYGDMIFEKEALNNLADLKVIYIDKNGDSREV